jgi:glycosyltransferase involved in cell wall biosynthesis
MNKAVALVDWRWVGHHPNYFVHYAAALAEAGCEVVPFCPVPEDFSARLAALGGSECLSAAQRIGAPQKIGEPRPSRLRPARFQPWHLAWRRFGALRRQLRSWEAAHGRKIDLVFFACIYDHMFRDFSRIERVLGYPWAGLYLHARSFRLPGSPIPYTGVMPCPERMFTGSQLQAVGVLDEGAVAPLSRLSGGKPVVVFPDFTEERVPEDDEEAAGLARKVKALAGARPIISLVGHLQWTKGLEDFTALAADMKGAFFFLAGDVNWTEIPEAKRRWMQERWERSNNIMAHLQYLPDVAMNKVLSVSDVIFAAYRSFPNSSNILTKSAVVERPVVVSEGYLMAERVRAFGLGEVVAEGNLEALIAAVKRMISPGYREQIAETARWADYRAAHSTKRLAHCFEQILRA